MNAGVAEVEVLFAPEATPAPDGLPDPGLPIGVVELPYVPDDDPADDPDDDDPEDDPDPETDPVPVGVDPLA